MNTVAIIEAAELQTASEVLSTTRSWVASYQKKHDKLLAKAQEHGVKLSKELDQELNDYLASLKIAAKTAEDSRKPFTQKLDQIKTQFTAEENKLKGALASDIQALRDASAKIYAQEAAKEAEEKAKELAQAKLKAELKVIADSELRKNYAEYLNLQKAELLSIFNGLELSQFDEFVKDLKEIAPNFSEEQWNELTPDLAGFEAALQYEGELSEIIADSVTGKYDLVKPHFISEMTNYFNFIISLVPQRIKDIEAGNAEKAAQKLKEEQELQAKAQAEANAKIEQEAKQAEISKAVIDVEVKSEAIKFSKPKTQTIESYSITVLSKQGWAELFKFYITNSDKEITEKTSLGTMRIFAEAEAKRTGVMVESDALHYEPKYKAVIKSKKAA